MDDASVDFDAYPGPERLPRVLSRAEALARGFTRDAIAHRLSTGRWQRVLPHTYLTGSTLTWSDRLHAALAFAGDEALLTGAAALADLGIRTVQRPRSTLLLVPYSTHVRPAGWVRLRRTARLPDAATLPGPRRAQLARAVADLALERPRLDDVRALVTQAIRARLCTAEQLHRELCEGPRRHSRNLRLALEEVGAGAWSAPEGRAARILRAADVPPFEQNARVDLPDGTFVIVDFLWRALRAVLEIDSIEHHHTTPEQIERTGDRHLKLESAAFSVTHRTPWLVFNEPERFARGIERWLAARARHIAA
ncbi:MAG: hypothetical protein ACRDWT_17565 [Jatrophihabitantaceae bacterium]